MKKIITIFTILNLSISTAFADNNIPINITKIYDGDTVEAKIDNNKFKIRLVGIDCYETSKINRAFKQAYANNLSIDEVTKRGKESKIYLENLYKQNKTQPISFSFKGIDVYGRVLGIIYFDKLNVNNELIKKGGCMVYEYNEH